MANIFSVIPLLWRCPHLLTPQDVPGLCSLFPAPDLESTASPMSSDSGWLENTFWVLGVLIDSGLSQLPNLSELEDTKLLNTKMRELWASANISNSNITFQGFYLTSLVLSSWFFSFTLKNLDSGINIITYFHYAMIYEFQKTPPIFVVTVKLPKAIFKIVCSSFCP